MKKTVGKIATELLEKEQPKITVIDQQRKMQEDYMKELLDTVDNGYDKYDGDFFIHVETKTEKLLNNVIRNYFIHRKTCPTPNYDQSVYRYNRQKGIIEYLWTIPDKETCWHLIYNANYVAKEERELLSFVIKYANGNLLKLCKEFNNEKEDSPELKESNGK